MEAAQRTFISSTFWTERIGPTAALQTLEVMERIRSWETITNTGKRIKDGLQRLATEHKLSIDVRGLAAMPNFNFVSERNLEYKTLISQEMLKCGFLAGNSVYASVAHTPEVIDRYFEALNRSFSLISRCEDGEDVRSFLEGSVCHNGLKKFK